MILTSCFTTKTLSLWHTQTHSLQLLKSKCWPLTKTFLFNSNTQLHSVFFLSVEFASWRGVSEWLSLCLWDMYVGVMFVWDVCYDRDHIVPLLLLDILRGRKVGKEEEEEEVGEEAGRREGRTGLCALVKWIDRWARKGLSDKEKIACVHKVQKEIC